MTIDHRLLDLLVCPLCKGPLTAARDDHQRVVELQCAADRLGFPVRDGMPVMLEAEARALDGAASGHGPSAAPTAPAA